MRFQKGHKGYWLGKKRSKETKDKIRLTKQGCIGFWRNKKRLNVSDKNHWTYNKKISVQTRQKMSESHEGQSLEQNHKLNCQCAYCKAKRGEYKGDKNPSWQGGKSFEPYSLGWTKTFKEQIRYRDGYKCQLCRVPEIEYYRKLDVHHIDYDKQNLKLNNLITLCQNCHMKTNGNREYWQKYFEERMNINELVRY